MRQFWLALCCAHLRTAAAADTFVVVPARLRRRLRRGVSWQASLAALINCNSERRESFLRCSPGESDTTSASINEKPRPNCF